MGKRPKVLLGEIQNAQPGVVNVIKVRDKRTYVWVKAERTCVLLAIGVLSISSKPGDKRTYVWAKAKWTCVLLAIGEQEREIQNAQVNFIKVQRQKKNVICRSKVAKQKNSSKHLKMYCHITMGAGSN